MRTLLIVAGFVVAASSALAQTPDCKTISDSLQRLKCYDAQSGAPASDAPAFTNEILKKEPAIGQLPPNAKVLIDDGTCPKGKLKQVVGGNVATGQARTRSCVPHP